MLQTLHLALHLELQISVHGRDVVVVQSDETVSPSQELIILVGAKGAFFQVALARILSWQPLWEISTPQKVNLRGDGTNELGTYVCLLVSIWF